jgi:hypothetical protein
MTGLVSANGSIAFVVMMGPRERRSLRLHAAFRDKHISLFFTKSAYFGKGFAQTLLTSLKVRAAERGEVNTPL